MLAFGINLIELPEMKVQYHSLEKGASLDILTYNYITFIISYISIFM